MFLQINNLQILGSYAVFCWPWPILLLLLPRLPPWPWTKAPSKGSTGRGSAVAVGRFDVLGTDHKLVCPSDHAPVHEQKLASLPAINAAEP